VQEKVVAVKAEAGPVTVVLRDARLQHRDLKYGVETLASPDTPAWQRVTLREDNGATLREVVGLLAKQFGEAKVDETMAAFTKGQPQERAKHPLVVLVAAASRRALRMFDEIVGRPSHLSERATADSAKCLGLAACKQVTVIVKPTEVMLATDD
jgi:hypothetical protein